jgi:DNA-binding SARP family transcriptional activator
VAIGILAILAGAMVMVQRARHRTPATAESATEPIGNGTDVDLEPSEAPPAPTSPLATPAVVPPEKKESSKLVPTVNIMGPVEILGLLQRSDRRIVEELLVYLVLHDRRHLRVGQIQIGLRPVGSKRPEISAKTLRNYLYELRRCVGSEHLPEASAREGYLIQGVPCDWVTFQHLAREADAVGGTAAIALRTEALALVRGTPFEGLPDDAFEWVDEEGLINQITVAVATCALRLATDHLKAEDYDAVTGAARAGYRGAPYDYGLWEVGARALDAKGDRAALKSWMAEAATKLDAEDVARIWDSLGHRPDSERS